MSVKVAERDDVGCIYEILNTVNGKRYIGITFSWRDRKYRHKYELNNNRHYNDHLQNAWNYYQSEAFEFNILIYTNKDRALWWEKHFINKFNSNNRDCGYNILSKGDVSDLEAKGSSIGTSRLKEDDVIEIKKLILNGKSNTEIASNYQVGRDTISKIRTNEQWTHVKPEGYNPNEVPGSLENNRINNKLTTKDVEKIKVLLTKGTTCKEISSKFNVSAKTIGDIKSKSCWSNVRRDLNDKFKNRRVKLNSKKVSKIKWLLNNTELSYRSIGEFYDVSKTCIGSVKRNETWQDVEPADEPPEEYLEEIEEEAA